MTVADQIQTSLASIQSAAASMKQFAQQTKDQEAKQSFQQLSQTLDDAVSTLQGRLNYVRNEGTSIWRIDILDDIDKIGSMLRNSIKKEAGLDLGKIQRRIEEILGHQLGSESSWLP